MAGLLTTTNEAFDRVAMHAVRRELLEAQAEAAGLPLHVIPLPWPCSNEEYEKRMRAAVAGFVADGFTHVAFGDLFLEDVRRYREERLAGIGLEPLFPIWKTKSTAALAQDMIAGGLQARLTCVDPRKLDRSFAGRAFDQSLLERLAGRAPIRAARTASSTRSRWRGRCSTIRSPSSSARSSIATVLCLQIFTAKTRIVARCTCISQAHRLPDRRDHRDPLPAR